MTRLRYPRRLSSRWPPFSLVPTQHGDSEFHFHQRGHSGIGIGSFALGVAMLVAGAVAWHWGMRDKVLMLGTVGIVSVCLIVFLMACTYTTKLVVDTSCGTAYLQRTLGGFDWVGATSASGLAICIAKIHRIRSGQLLGPWCGYCAVFVGDNTILCALSISKDWYAIQSYVATLPPPFQLMVIEVDQTIVADY